MTIPVPNLPAESESAPRPSPLGHVQPGIVAVGGLLAVQWVSEIVDFFMDHRLDAYGVRPHQLLGLRGIAFAPFLHSGFRHLIGNTVPFALLGVLIALGGLRQLVSVTVVVAFISGLGMWIFGSSNEVHIGASGVVFGYLAYLLVRGVFARNIRQILLGVVLAAVYGGLLWGVLPTTQGVSWEGHLFGVVGGVVAAKLLVRPEARHGLTDPA